MEDPERCEIRNTHPDLVLATRQYVKDKCLCHACGNRLHARENGADHPDWPKRILHKKCWRGFMQMNGTLIGPEMDID